MNSIDTNYPERTLSLGDNFSKKFADRQMRNNIHNVQTLKNRLKVLSSQADYNRFRSKYQSEKIEKHHKIHQLAQAQRQQIQQRLKLRVDTEVKKQKAYKIKQQLRERLEQVQERLKDEKMEKRNDIKTRTDKNRQLLVLRRAKDLQKRRQMKEQVSQMKSGIREALQRYTEEKLGDIKSIRESEKKQYLNYSAEMARQLELLSQKQKQLIDENSQSMKSSRLLDFQYKKLYSNKGKDHSMLLPQIKKSPTNSTSIHFE